MKKIPFFFSLSKKSAYTILSICILTICVIAILKSYFIEIDDGGGVIIMTAVYFLLSSIVGFVLASFFLYRRAYMKNQSKLSFYYIFTGMLNFIIGILFLINCIATRQIPQFLIFTILFLINLVAGFFMLIDIYVLKPE